MSIALLVGLGGRVLPIVLLSCEMVSYLIYKLIRNDFRYWVTLPGCWSMLASLVFRVIVKVLADFTGMLHLRHPNEMGGAYWLFNMAYTQISMFLILSMSSAPEGAAISKGDLWIVAIVLASLWVTAIVVLLRFSEKGFEHTFYETVTSKQIQFLRFQVGDNRTKMTILTTVHRAIWKKFAGEMREWLGEVWNELHQTKPIWFGDDVVRKIPMDFIPHISHASVRSEMTKHGLTDGGGLNPRGDRRGTRSMNSIRMAIDALGDGASPRGHSSVKDISTLVVINDALGD